MPVLLKINIAMPDFGEKFPSKNINIRKICWDKKHNPKNNL